MISPEFRTGPPKKLKTESSVSFSAVYDGAEYPNIVCGRPQRFCFWFPFFLMSGVGQVWIKVKEFKGTLELHGSEPVDTPEGTMTSVAFSIVPTREEIE